MSNVRSAARLGAGDTVLDEHNHPDEIDRRGFLKCMAWAGTGVVWALSAGILSSRTLSQASNATPGDFSFVQVSDSHIGFNNVPNMDVAGTFQKAIDRVVALTSRPSFILHTGDVSHLSMPAQYDTVDQIRFGQGSTTNGWRSFDFKGVHFVGLVNVWNLKAGGFGVLGDDS